MENTQGARDFAKLAAEARARKLSPERRREIARNAVLTRWANAAENSGILNVVAGTPDRPLKIGDAELECYVLENGQRVISNRGMQRALGMDNATGNRLLQFLNKKGIKPYVQAKINLEKLVPIKFRAPITEKRSAIAFGFDATVLKDICDIALSYRRDNPDQLSDLDKTISQKAELLLSGFASVGIIALIDEVTGYQDVRAHNELQLILEKYIAPELLQWTRRFPIEFYKQLFRVYGFGFSPMAIKKPSVVGNLTKKLVYEKLPKGVYDELLRLNPKNDNGNRLYKHHQFLSEDIGNPHLEKQISTVTTLLRISDNKEQFKNLFGRAFPDNPEQTQIS